MDTFLAQMERDCECGSVQVDDGHSRKVGVEAGETKQHINCEVIN
jgi:hypothetical protein